jgi:hypothetical protein
MNVPPMGPEFTDVQMIVGFILSALVSISAALLYIKCVPNGTQSSKENSS